MLGVAVAEMLRSSSPPAKYPLWKADEIPNTAQMFAPIAYFGRWLRSFARGRFYEYVARITSCRLDEEDRFRYSSFIRET